MTGDPISILQLTHHGEGAGSTRSIASLSQHLARRGHRVLVGCRAGTTLERWSRDAGLETVALDFQHVRNLADQIAGLVRTRAIQLINAHDTRDRRALTWLRWRGRLPQAFVATRRTMPLTSPLELLAVGLSADRTIAVSDSVAQALRRRLYPAARLRVVPNGVDLTRVDAPPSAADLEQARAAIRNGGPPDDRPLIVIVARRKRQDVALRALQHLSRPVTLACIGIELDAGLQALVDRVPRQHRVVFVPFSDRPLAFYHLAAVAALPSTIEGLSQALLEAMALGVPVVASATGGNVDLVTSGVNGLLVPTLDAAAWARAFDQLLGDRNVARRLAQAGRALVRSEFTIERTVERTEAVYREALARRLPRGESRD
jgi:glycosyltransferase involved in cell wall biosynthesis